MESPVYYYTTETENGSHVRLKTYIKGPYTAWVGPTRCTIVYIDLLNEADLKIIEDLGLPRWNFDFTGKGMVFEKGKLDYGVTQKQLDALKLKTPYKPEIQ